MAKVLTYRLHFFYALVAPLGNYLKKTLAIFFIIPGYTVDTPLRWIEMCFFQKTHYFNKNFGEQSFSYLLWMKALNIGFSRKINRKLHKCRKYNSYEMNHVRVKKSKNHYFCAEI